MIDVFPIVICLGLPLLWGLWRWERRRVAEETRRTIMASVMDTQNNLLNNLVWLQTVAGSGKPLNPADLTRIDRAIQESRHRLTEIAEADLSAKRDLSGICVVAVPKPKFTG